MNAFEHQLSILNAIAAGKTIESRRRRSEQFSTEPPPSWVKIASHPHLLNFAEWEYRIAPPGTEPVYAVWDNESGLYVNQIFHGPAAATQYAVSGNAAARSENRFVPVKLQRAPDGT